MYWSWHLFHGDTVGISESTHIQLQEEFQKELAELVVKQNPEAFSIKIEKFWTRTLDPSRVRAFFEISYKESGLETEIDVLKKGTTDLVLSKEEENTQYWNAETLSIDGQVIEFSEGIVFKPGDVN